MIEWVNAFVQGILLGGLYALFAAGLSLIFGVMRLVNIAHGDLIIVAAYLGLTTTGLLGLHPFAALLIVMPLMAGLGYGLQRGLLNRTLGDDILPPLLVTFGLSVIIQNVLLEGYTADPQRLAGGAIETASLTVGGLAIGVLPLLTFAIAVVVIAALQWIFYSTGLGRGFRAVSDNQDIAQIMGFNKAHVFGLAMALALAVTAIAGILLGVRTSFDPSIGGGRLIFGFEAVIIGGLGNLWGTLAGGVILGVAQTIGAKIDPGWQLLAGHIAFLAVLVVRPERPVPESGTLSAPSVTRATRASRIAMAVGLVALLVLAAAPWWAGRADLRLMGEIFLYLSLACLWNLMAGYAGLVSVGQQAYVGFGGYMLFALAMFGGLHPVVAILCAGVLAAAVSVPVAVLIFRLRGAYFAIGTWVVAEVFRLSFAKVSALGGGSGSSLPVGILKSLASSRSGREALSYWLALGAAVVVIGAVYFFLRSRRGLALTAIRDSEVAAEGLGIDIWRTKLEVYVVTSAFTAIIGGLIFLQKLRISPDAAFSVNDWTAFVIFIVVIGGIGTLEGPIIGTLIFFALRETLADFGTIYLIALGLVAIVVMLKAPKGLWGLIRDRYGLELFPLSYRVQLRDDQKGT